MSCRRAISSLCVWATFLALARVDHPAANGHAQQSLTLCLELGDTRGCTYSLEALEAT